MKLIADEMIMLLGLPEHDDNILDILEYIGEDSETIEINSEKVEEKYGFLFSFDYEILTEKQKKDTSGAKFLNQISFTYMFEKLPLNLNDTDNYNTIVKKLGIDAKYICQDDKNTLYWMFKEKGYMLVIIFEDERLEEVYELIFNTYEEITSGVKLFIPKKENT